MLLVALHVVDGLPLYLTALGIFCHVVYLQNFSRTWPSISLTSIPFLASCALVVLSHFASFSYFSERAREPRHYGAYGAKKYGAAASRWGGASTGGWGGGRASDETFMEVATYFGVCVWLVPMFLFLSLSANDNVLPSAGAWLSVLSPCVMLTYDCTGDLSASQSASTPTAHYHQRKQSSMMKSALSSAFSLFLRNPRGASQQREGLIASPVRSRPPTPPSSYQQPAGSYSPSLAGGQGGLWNSSNGSGSSPPPPRSPALGYPSPQLGGPPRRPSMPAPPVRRNTDNPPSSPGAFSHHTPAFTAAIDRRPSTGNLRASTRGLSRRPSMEPLMTGAMGVGGVGGEGPARSDGSPPLGVASLGSPITGLTKRRA